MKADADLNSFDWLKFKWPLPLPASVTTIGREQWQIQSLLGAEWRSWKIGCIKLLRTIAPAILLERFGQSAKVVQLFSSITLRHALVLHIFKDLLFHIQCLFIVK